MFLGVTTDVEFWFDPMCPWAWITSRWVTEVARLRDVNVTWSVMSLAILNEGKPVSPQYAAAMEAAWGPVRVCIAAAERHGNAVLGPLYTAFGTRLHVEARTDYSKIITESVADAGLEPSLAAAATSADFDQQLRTSHQRAVDLVGDDVGTPVIAVPDAQGEPVAFFGPIVTPAPLGEHALRLWDGTLMVAGTPGFFELKRSRDEEPRFD